MAKTKGSRGQNEGSIRQRKDGTWEARYMVNGKHKSIYGKTRPEVGAKLTKALNEINTGSYIEPSKLTVSAWLDEWMKTYKKNSVKIKTFSSYEDTIRLHIKPHIGNLNLKDLQSHQVQNIISNKGLSPRMAKYVHTILSMAITQAVKCELVLKNVCDSITLPKQKKKDIRVLTLQEQSAFTEAIKGHRLEAAFVLDLFTGLRIGELLALKWSDIDMKEGVLKVSRNVQRVRIGKKTELVYGSPKSESGNRSIPLIESIVSLLKRHKKYQTEERLTAGELYNHTDFVFTTEFGKPIETRNFQRLFYELVKKANLENVNFHALRHTFATRGLEAGITPKEMQAFLGHSSIIMTMDIYSHVLPDQKRSAMNKLKDLMNM